MNVTMLTAFIFLIVPYACNNQEPKASTRSSNQTVPNPIHSQKISENLDFNSPKTVSTTDIKSVLKTSTVTNTNTHTVSYLPVLNTNTNTNTHTNTNTCSTTDMMKDMTLSFKISNTAYSWSNMGSNLCDAVIDCSSLQTNPNEAAKLKLELSGQISAVVNFSQITNNTLIFKQGFGTNCSLIDANTACNPVSFPAKDISQLKLSKLGFTVSKSSGAQLTCGALEPLCTESNILTLTGLTVAISTNSFDNRVIYQNNALNQVFSTKKGITSWIANDFISNPFWTELSKTLCP